MKAMKALNVSAKPVGGWFDTVRSDDPMSINCANTERFHENGRSGFGEGKSWQRHRGYAWTAWKLDGRQRMPDSSQYIHVYAKSARLKAEALKSWLDATNELKVSLAINQLSDLYLSRFSKPARWSTDIKSRRLYLVSY